MNRLQKTGATFAVIAAALVVGATVYGDGYLINALSASVTRGSAPAGPADHLLFPGRKIAAGSAAPWRKHPDYNAAALSETLVKTLEVTESIAYLVVKDGQLLHEYYFRGHGADGISNSFSMAKPVVGMLLGFAVSDGRLASLEDPVSHHLEAYDGGLAAKLKIVDLIRMTSGMRWDDPEVYDNILASTARLYYTDDLSRFIGPMPIDTEPGARFHYNSANTVLAARIVEKAVGMNVSEYLEKKLWQPLGMEHDANWMLDHEGGEEKAFCCLSASARDFARLGQFVLQQGAWEGKQLLPRNFFRAALAHSSRNYGYGFRMDDEHQPAFSMFRGTSGQLIIMIPEYDMVIVKLGRKALPDDPGTALVRAPETYTLVTEAIREVARPPSAAVR